ncbi:DUF1127 domain-containing protein [Methylobacterium oxalidis]|uniref:YjiS-like domain-containing protein n=1 Tax=Methylobacterium oxalidis TaxID=944322 RepID=A0A512J7G5_9HYPH|nr:DUF1127 domain-containing protein [Methylobacterium oxalidis]GEP05842.1 hypothetical protein MOX02_38800 [Methylobacterium oxalidis]GJE34428.1 hypothetical protein LDDCCGHA_4639 [Methylobacterium oxalidis]GLS66451.1 hypothetical protein GCM10007888_48340 [Methylobacterium oxalidis]
MFTSIVRNIRIWRQTRRNVRYLAALDDRLLADIGIERTDLAKRRVRP